jgi:hypothetical protein
MLYRNIRQKRQKKHQLKAYVMRKSLRRYIAFRKKLNLVKKLKIGNYTTYLKQHRKRKKYFKITLNKNRSKTKTKKAKHSNPYLFLNISNKNNLLPTNVLDISLSRYLSKFTSYKIRAFRSQYSYYKAKTKKVKTNKLVNSRIFRINSASNNPLKFFKNKKSNIFYNSNFAHKSLILSTFSRDRKIKKTYRIKNAKQRNHFKGKPKTQRNNSLNVKLRDKMIPNSLSKDFKLFFRNLKISVKNPIIF